MNTINLSLTKDTYIYSEFPDKNYFRGNILKTGNATSKDTKISRVHSTLIKFNCEEISNLSTIYEAKIYLYIERIYSKQNKPIYISISKNTSDFEYTSVTSNTAPNIMYSDSIIQPVSSDTRDKYLEIDLSKFVQEWVNGICPNYGITISIANSKEYIFFSSSRSKTPPHATIRYIPKKIQESATQDLVTQSSPPLLQVASISNKNNTTKNNSTSITPEIASKSFGFIYNQNVSQVFVHGGNDINLSNNGLLSNISHQEGTSSIKINSSGTYSVNYSISATSIINSEISLTLNGTIIPSSSKNIVQETGDVYGTLLLELNSGDILTFRNTSSTVLQLSPNVNLNCTIMQHI